MTIFKNKTKEDVMVALPNEEFPHAPNWKSVKAGAEAELADNIAEPHVRSGKLEAVEVKATESAVGPVKVETKQVEKPKKKKRW